MRVDPLDLKREDIVPAHKALPVPLSSDHERELNNLVRAHSTPQKLAERARIILLAATGQGIDETGKVKGTFRASGIRPKFAERLATAGCRLRPALFDSQMEV